MTTVRGSFTFVAMTYNVWGDYRVAERLPALRALLETRAPDLLAVQELSPLARDAFDAALPGFERVRDEGVGWAWQSNLWWRRELFEMEQCGAEDVGIRAPYAALFWVRLRPLGAAGTGSLLFSTAHLTWAGHPQESADRISPRPDEARRIVEALNHLAGDGACIFTTDINDIGPPNWAVASGGFTDSFTSLRRYSPPTHPVHPLPFPFPDGAGLGTRLSPLQTPMKAIDWIFHRGPLVTRSSEVVEFFHEGSAPSDHKPVVATFTLPGGSHE